jgi:hypothetical protein
MRQFGGKVAERPLELAWTVVSQAVMITHRGNRSHAMTARLTALAAASVAGGGLLVGCGASTSAGAPRATATSPAATAAPASTEPRARSAAALAKGSLAALRSGISVHADTESVSQNGAADNSQDLTAKAGRAVMTAPTGARVTELFAGGVAYLQGNALGLTRFVGVSPAFAQRYAGQWIALQPGEQVGYADYDAIISELTLAGQADQLVMAAPEKLTGAATVAGHRVIGVSGPLPASDQLPAGTRQVLYAADDPTLRPVRVTLQGGSITSSTTFSGWGERVDLKPPPDSLPEATLPPST